MVCFTRLHFALSCPIIPPIPLNSKLLLSLFTTVEDEFRFIGLVKSRTQQEGR
jgi:hypothetical protein